MNKNNPRSSFFLANIALKFTAWTEKYLPDAFVFALLATGIVFVLGMMVAHASPSKIVMSWGNGFWELIPFTMQMCLIVITGYVLATAAPIHKLIVKVALLPKSAKWAVVMVALFSMLTAWVNWGFSLIFSAILVREVAIIRKDADYRALAAACFLGQGSIWAQGLSGSAVLQMTTPGALQPAIRTIVAGHGSIPEGIIHLKDTVFLWQSLVAVIIEIVIVAVVTYFIAPNAAMAKSAKDLGIDLTTNTNAPQVAHIDVKSRTPGEWLEHQPLLNILVFGLGAIYLFKIFSQATNITDAITLNTINLAFLIVGFLLHWTPARLAQSVKNATPAVWGVILQFPFYAGIAGIIVYTGLNDKIVHFVVAIANHNTFPPLISLYSTILGVFVPSGGSKWVIEAPYVMAAAHVLKVHLGWTVVVYDLGEALANLVQPFWMLPILAILGLKARDIMGYTFTIFLVLFPVVLILVTVLGMTLGYPL